MLHTRRQKWEIEAQDQTLGKRSIAENKLGIGSQRPNFGEMVSSKR